MLLEQLHSKHDVGLTILLQMNHMPLEQLLQKHQLFVNKEHRMSGYFCLHSFTIDP